MLRARHATYYRRFAEGANERLRGGAASVWQARLNPELANLKVALDWHLHTGDIDGALSMVSGMAWLWFVNSDFAEGARWLASVLGAEGKRRAELHAGPRSGTATSSAYRPARRRASSSATRPLVS